ncbi:MAG: hypothetical protein ACRDJH_17720 [Thermomicrobiales bacterium]
MPPSTPRRGLTRTGRPTTREHLTFVDLVRIFPRYQESRNLFGWCWDEGRLPA